MYLAIARACMRMIIKLIAARPGSNAWAAAWRAAGKIKAKKPKDI